MPRSAIDHLAIAGIIAEHTGDLGLASADDSEILEAARIRQAVIVTLDADFHQQLALLGATSPSTIRIRIKGLKGDRLAALLRDVLLNTEAELKAGAAVSVTPTRIRVRRLPIGG